MYIELAKWGYHLEELYAMSIKELLFSLKYIREGKAYEYWKIGIAAGSGFNAKNYPKDPKTLSPELFEKKPSVRMPKWLEEDYGKKINQIYREGRN